MAHIAKVLRSVSSHFACGNTYAADQSMMSLTQCEQVSGVFQLYVAWAPVVGDKLGRFKIMGKITQGKPNFRGKSNCLCLEI